jgi:hypothetical protein
MAKLIVSCECGQESRVADTAMGKTGLCPYCRRKLRITASNTRPASEEEAGQGRGERWQRWRAPSGKAIERFGRAVDCYKGGRYGEALAILDGLAQQYPQNPEIEHARFQCVQALQRPRLQDPEEAREAVEKGELTEEAVRRVVLEKLLKGGGESDAVQLQAARLAADLLGMTTPARPFAEPGAADDESNPGRRSGNGHKRYTTGPPPEDAADSEPAEEGTPGDPADA